MRSPLVVLHGARVLPRPSHDAGLQAAAGVGYRPHDFGDPGVVGLGQRRLDGRRAEHEHARQRLVGGRHGLVLHEAERPSPAAESARLPDQLARVADEEDAVGARALQLLEQRRQRLRDERVAQMDHDGVAVEDRRGGAERLHEPLGLLDLEAADPKPFDALADQAVHIGRRAGRNEHRDVVDPCNEQSPVRADREERPVGDREPVRGPRPGKGGDLVVPRRRCEE